MAAISSPAQDHVIEKILRSRNEWDPPWLRSRPPRGPPSKHAPAQSPAIDSQRLLCEELEDLWAEQDCVDPPHPED